MNSQEAAGKFPLRLLLLTDGGLADDDAPLRMSSRALTAIMTLSSSASRERCLDPSFVDPFSASNREWEDAGEHGEERAVFEFGLVGDEGEDVIEL